MRTITRNLSAGICLAVCCAAQAALIADEDFSYPDGALAGQSGGSGRGTAWTGPATVSGGVLNTGPAGSANFRGFSSNIPVTAGTAVYVRFDMSAGTAGAGDFAGFSFYSAAGEELFFGMTFNTDSYGINWPGRYNGNSGVSASALVASLVGEILFGAVSTTVNLYVNPGSALGTPNDTFTYATSDLGGSWDRARFASQSTQATFDNLVIGTTAAAVRAARVPEPETHYLVGLALLGLACARRKWSV